MEKEVGKVFRAGSLEWRHIPSPEGDDVARLRDLYPQIHDLDLADILSRRQRPKIDRYPDYLFVVLHFPYYNKARQRLETVELDTFLGRDFLITLPNHPLPGIERIWQDLEMDARLLGESEEEHGSVGYLFYRILKEMVQDCWPILDQIGYKLDKLDDEIWAGGGRSMMREISRVKQEIIAYRRTIKPERTTLRQLETNIRQWHPELEGYYDDIVDAVERMWDILDNYVEISRALEETNESVIQHRLNDILLILTVTSVTFLPLTLLSGIYGMNVSLPGEHAHGAFWGIIIVMAIVAALLLFSYRFWRRRF